MVGGGNVSEGNLSENGDKGDVGILGGFFRASAAVLRSSMPMIQGGVRVVGQARPLAFASEGGVAAKTLIPKPFYYSLWGYVCSTEYISHIAYARIL